MSTGESYPLEFEQSYRKELEVRQSGLEENDKDLHDYILSGLGNLEQEDFSYIFGVEKPSRIISEGEKIAGDTIVEDFAITGSYQGGEMALGQVVSCDSKEVIDSVPKDYIQINGFGKEIERNPEIDPEITGYYIVRSEYDREEIHKRNRLFNRDLDFYGRSDIPVEIYRVEPDGRDIADALREFYSSLAQS
ncbi:MAG: hypothetical protein ACI9LV_000802 [Candidatus Nanohaloarchaea archaeon]